MTESEIIKVMERCGQYQTTDVRTYKGIPIEVFSEAVLDLIHRKNAEIEDLKEEVEALSDFYMESTIAKEMGVE